MREKILCLIVAYLLIIPSVYAEERKDEWWDKAYNFKQLRTILLVTNISEDVRLDASDQRKLHALFDTEILRNSKDKSRVRIITSEQLEASIANVTGEDLQTLRLNDPAKYKEIMQTYTAIYVDGTFKVDVSELGYTRVWIPEKVETYTENQEVTVTTELRDANGRVTGTSTSKVTIPVEKVRVIPAHYLYTGHAGATFTIAEEKKQQPIWTIVDIREAYDKDPFGMMQRILKRTMDKWNELASAF